MSTNKYISDELLAAFIDGNISEDENIRILESIGDNPQNFEEFHLAAMASNLGCDNESLPTYIFRHPIESISLQSNYNCSYSVALNDDISHEPNDICAIKSEQLILSQIGIDISTQELIKLSAEKGWYTAGRGTMIEYVGNILEYYGMHVERRKGGTIRDIYRNLRKGIHVMLCVDAGELTGDIGAEYYEDVFSGEIADHAVVVANISTNGEVVIHDTATTELKDNYPAWQLLDAWADSEYYMITAKKL